MTFCGPMDTGDQIKNRGFPCTVGTDETANLTGFNVEIKPVNRPQAAKKNASCF